jgi:hypothetical protein
LRLVALLLVAVLAIVAFVGVAYAVLPAEPGPAPLPEASDPLLPDLVMGPITDVAGTVGEGGREQIRFAATIVNIGEGEFIVQARRGQPFADWEIAQRIAERGGGETERATEATAVFGGDGHDHWHIRGVEAHQLVRPSDGAVLGEVVKQGFCFFDTDPMFPDLPGAPPEAVHHSSGCGNVWDVRLRMGLSVGWGDRYSWTLVDQRILIDDVPDGRYRIVQTADLEDHFLEADETNNETWVEVELVRRDGLPYVTVVAEAPIVTPTAAGPPPTIPFLTDVPQAGTRHRRTAVLPRTDRSARSMTATVRRSS